MRLQSRLYGICLVHFLACRFPCMPKLAYLCESLIKIFNCDKKVNYFKTVISFEFTDSYAQIIQYVKLDYIDYIYIQISIFPIPPILYMNIYVN